MLKRKMSRILEEWKKDGAKKALCIVGARQVGKSTVVREFVKSHYENFLELDFLNNPRARLLFSDRSSVQDILIGLETYSPTELTPGKTLILLDEIQECPEARTAVKYLVEDGRFDYIETGSLLGVKIRNIRSYPVGFETLVNMYPLDFEEFMWAMNIQQSVINYLKDCYENQRPVSLAVHEQMLDVFRTYIAVGGMPEAVQSFVDHKSIHPVQKIQENIVNLYRLDITKCAQISDRVKIQNLFDSIPAQLKEKSPRFFLNRVYPNARMNVYEGSLAWLIESQEILPCYGLEEPQQPLQLNRKNTLFRLFFLDTGLLCSLLGEDIQADILLRQNRMNMGCVFENAFADQLVANGFELYYFNRKNLGEIDFVISWKDSVDLIEIKSGTDFENHPALTKILKQQNTWKFRRKIVFCQSPGMVKGEIEYLPWYMIFLYRKPEPKEVQMDFNFESINVPEE